MHHPVAFRCKSCGHLHSADHAGEATAPHACTVCGAGVQFSAKGVKSLNPENWEVLAECTPERLAELGLEPHHCCKHTPHKKGDNPTGRLPQRFERTAVEGVESVDKV